MIKSVQGESIDIVGAGWSAAFGVIGAAIGTIFGPGPGTVAGKVIGVTIGTATGIAADIIYEHFMDPAFDDYF